MTIAARYCPTYESVTANLARNDIQESLKDLGPDTLYTAGKPIDPDLEAQGQPACKPLPNWTFTLGTGYRTRAVSGHWGSLSIVTGELRKTVTKDSIPLLNSSGNATGRDLQGAVRIELTQAELNLAAQRQQLWIQGGTTTDPVLDAQYPHEYGFAALRCSIDNLNGDNVEYITIPSGARNVFCFAYYVTPPPSAGTIVVRKVVNAPADVAAQDFVFSGNLSFNADGTFVLNAGPGKTASQTFYRAGGVTWNIHEIVDPGWGVPTITCSSQNGASTWQIFAGTPDSSINLATGDTVTCTYTNGLAPPPSGLSLGKMTLGRTGSTAFHVEGPSAIDAPVRTTQPGKPVWINRSQLPSGTYTITETPEDVPGGRWIRAQVRCGGRILPSFSGDLERTISPGFGEFCLFVNRFQPTGRIRVRKVTEGGTGTTTFAIRPIDADPPVVYQQQATTTREGTPVLATGDDTDGILIGTYDIQESTTSNAGSGGWRLESVTCDGIPVGSAQGRIRIRLTEDDPSADCTFTNVKTTTPGGGGGGGDNGGVEGETTADPETNLRITKSVTPSDIVAGQSARYRVVVTNTSDVTARSVVINELSPPSNHFVRIRAPKGVRCRGTRPLRCVVGTLRPHRRVVLSATVRTPLTGRVVNRVAVNTSTRETRLVDNQARATLRVHTVSPVACIAARVRC